MSNVYKTFYASQFEALFIKIYHYEGAIIARACVEVMKGLPREQVESLAFVVADLQEVGSASLRDSDGALQNQLFNQLKNLGADNSSIQFVCILDSSNANNKIVLERLSRAKSFYEYMPERTSLLFSWHEAMDLLSAPRDYIVAYPEEMGSE